MKRLVHSRVLALSRLSVVVIALSQFPIPLYSQTPEWMVFNTDNSGLPYNYLTGIAIDAQGGVWIATGQEYQPVGEGLVHFDGEHWRVYNTDNSKA